MEKKKDGLTDQGGYVTKNNFQHLMTLQFLSSLRNAGCLTKQNFKSFEQSFVLLSWLSLWRCHSCAVDGAGILLLQGVFINFYLSGYFSQTGSEMECGLKPGEQEHLRQSQGDNKEWDFFFSPPWEDKWDNDAVSLRFTILILENLKIFPSTVLALS